MANRRGPQSGYDTGTKRHYRREVYKQVRAAFSNQMCDKRCVIMPSIEGDEIDSALHAGFRESNICIVDDNPAIVATLKRKYPRVTAYGVPIADVAVRVVKDIGQVDFVNFDLCGPIGRGLWDSLRPWTTNRAIADSGLVAVTVLRGRERGQFAEDVTFGRVLMDDAAEPSVKSDRDWIRLTRIGAALCGHDQDCVGRELTPEESIDSRYCAFHVRSNVYRSAAGHQTMLWGMWKLHSRPCFCDECFAAFVAMHTSYDLSKDSDLCKAMSCYFTVHAAVYGAECVKQHAKPSGRVLPRSEWRIPNARPLVLMTAR